MIKLGRNVFFLSTVVGSFGMIYFTSMFWLRSGGTQIKEVTTVMFFFSPNVTVMKLATD